LYVHLKLSYNKQQLLIVCLLLKTETQAHRFLFNSYLTMAMLRRARAAPQVWRLWPWP